MRKILSLTLLLLFVVGLSAQAAKKEALESLDAAKALINSGDYIKAQEELNYAQAKVSEILSEELLKHIPEKAQGFTFESKEAGSLGQAGAFLGSANAVAATGHYSKGNGTYDLLITMGGVVGQAGNLMSGFASMFGGLAAATSQMRIKGYTGTMDFDKENNSGTLTISVGTKLSVIVSGEDIKSPDDLKTLAEQMDLSLLEKSF